MRRLAIQALGSMGGAAGMAEADSMVYRKTDSIHHHHPEGVVYRGFCLNSSTVAVSKFPFRWWWCIESVFPVYYYLIYYDIPYYD